MDKKIVHIIDAILLIALILIAMFSCWFISVANAAEPPPNLPEPPPGCELGGYVEWPEPPLAWGGWIVDAPFQMCGVAGLGLGKWHSLFQEDCVKSSSGKTNCQVSWNDGITLITKSRLADNSNRTRIEGFDVSGPGLRAAAFYIPVEIQSNQVYKTLLPMVSAKCIFQPDTRICWLNPPIPPTPVP